MVNIHKFFDSNAVRNYNKDINRQYTPLEQVAIIAQSTKTTIAQKNGALREIYNTYKDDGEYGLELLDKEQFINDPAVEKCGIRETIINTINLWNNLIEGEPLYEADMIYYEANTFWDKEYNLSSVKVFPTFQSALKYIRKESDHDFYKEIPPSEVHSVITQSYINEEDGCNNMVRYIFNYEAGITNIEIDLDYFYDNPKFLFDITALFVHIDTPFKRGDILRFKDRFVPYYGVLRDDDKRTPNEGVIFSPMNYGIIKCGYRKISAATFYKDFGFDYTDDSNISTAEYAVESDLEGADRVLLMIRDIYLDNRDFISIMYSGKSTINGLIDYANTSVEYGKSK